MAIANHLYKVLFLFRGKTRFRLLFINTPKFVQSLHALTLTPSQDSPPENVPRNPRGVIGGLSGSNVTAKKFRFYKKS